MTDYIVKITLPIAVYVDNAGEKAEAIVRAKELIRGFENLDITKGHSTRLEIGQGQAYDTEKVTVPF